MGRVFHHSSGEGSSYFSGLLLIPSFARVFIYNIQFQYTRWGAVCPGTFTSVLMIGVKCSSLRAKAAPFFSNLALVG